ncbi:hypothetical protein GOM49_12675 [Clostridium bovifaecis]|uniref:Uncharacterized protein n=1 Tax=Clostridium bovifaecis TaxID=2184719 RepID=A0A6I6FDA7_9CLOT|nr:hypothetical protein GOM49_12675 [Clostridium bovifaecis]
MKAQARKKMFNIIIAIVAIGMIVSLFAGIKISGGNSKGSNEVVIAEVAKAQVGAVARVNLTDLGKEQYNTAAKFQIYDGEKNISAVSPFNERITIFPAKKEKDKVTIKLFDNSNKEIDNVEVSLKQLKK